MLFLFIICYQNDNTTVTIFQKIGYIFVVKSTNFINSYIMRTILCFVMVLFCFMQGSFGQVNIINTETMFNGTGGTSGDAIATHESNNRFENDVLTMSGTGDMRTTNASSGYTTASGAAASGTWNALLNANTETFIISGINTTTYTSISLSFGIRKSTTTENGSSIAIEISTDGVSWTALTMPALPTGTGTATWYYRTCTGSIPSTSNLRIRFTSSYGTNLFNIDDIELRGTTACSAPSTQASSLSSNTPAVDGFNAAWTAGNGSGTMIVVRPTAQTNAAPVSGTAYTADLDWASAAQINTNNRVVFRAAGTSAGPVTGLTAETQYTLTAYEYNATGDCYNTTSAPTTTRWTLSTEPTAHASTFTSTASNYNQIDLTYTVPGSGADGYVILRRDDGAAPTTTGITDGVAPASWSLPSGTTIVNANATGTSWNNTGLSGSTSYCYLLIPFNWNGTDAQTYNYRTAASVPSTCSTTPAAPSLLSDIITDASYTYTSNIDYLVNQSASPLTNTSGNVGVFRFTIRDGGASSPDADALPTILTGITFSSITGTSMIRAAALFDGNAMVANTPTINTGTNTISFTGLSYSTSDNSTRNLTLRVSFLTTVTDSTQMVFNIASADVSSAGGLTSSQFTSFTTATSSTIANRNRISVIVDRLRFIQNASNVTVSSNMTPAVTVAGVDINLNTDINFTGSIDITSTGTLSGSPVNASAVNGVATFSTLVHTASATARTLTATTSGLSFSNTVNSSNFDIINVPANSYRSTSAGTWSGATWERLISGTWTASAAPATNTTNNVYIRHAVTSGGSISPANIIITDGGTFTITASSTIGTSLLVESGGTLQVDASLTVSGTFTVQDTGDVILNFDFANPSTSIWAGVENFAPYSNLYIWDWLVTGASNQPLINNNVTTNTYSGYTAAFGNVYIDLAGSSVAANWEMLGNSYGTTNLCHGNFEIVSPNGFDIRFVSTAGVTVVVGIKGNFVMNSGWSSARTVILGTSTANVTLNLKGNFVMDCPGDFTVRASNSAGGGVTMNIDSNLLMNGPNTTANTNFKLNQNAYGTANGALAIVNLKGNLTVGANPTIINLGAKADQQFNFTGSTTQLVNVASNIGGASSPGVPLYVKNGAYVQLNTNNLSLNNGSSLDVETGATLDFGFNGTTALLVVNGGTGTNTFASAQSSTLKITHPNGLVKTVANDGNVQLSVSNKNFNQTATFWYIGKVNQASGDAITTGSTPKVIICDLLDNTKELTLTNSTAISGTTTVDAVYGGHLYIKVGKVMESTTAYITGGGGTLRMEPGTYYYIPKGNVDIATSDADPIPRLSSAIHSSGQYYLNGGTIELAGTGAANAFQSLRGNTIDPKIYKNIVFSGSNTYLTDFKNLTSTVVIDSTLYITGDAIVECLGGGLTPQSFTGNGSLIMDNNARIRFKKLSTLQPELLATSTSPARNYSLTGNSIVEFYGTSNTQNQVLRGTDGKSTTITYANIVINANAANNNNGSSFYNVSPSSSFGLSGTLTINKPAVFRFDETESVSGTGNIVVSDSSTLLYGSPNGIKTSGTGTSDGNIRISGTRTFSTNASYGFIGNGAMVSGNGLPAQVLNLYIDKIGNQDVITLTNSVEAKERITFRSNGIVSTGSNILYVSNTDTNSVRGFTAPNTTGTYDNDNYVIGNLRRALTGTTPYIFPIGDIVSGEAYNPVILYPTSTAAGNVTAKFVVGDAGSINTGGKINFTCGGVPKFLEYTDLTGQGYWQLDGDVAAQTFTYNITLHSNSANLNTSPNDSTANGHRNNYRALKTLSSNAGGTWPIAAATDGDECSVGSYFAIPGNGYTGFSIFAAGGGSSPSTALPVELSAFTVYVNDQQQAVLNWTTQTEINNDKFIIEHSTNALDFSVIGEVKGKGTTTEIQHYSHTHLQANTGLNYYRLKQVDFDASFDYSPIRSITISNNQHVVIYPNPANEMAYITIQPSTTPTDIAMYDLFGRVVYTNSTIESIHQIDLKSIPDGKYIVRIRSNERIETVSLTVK